MTACKALFALLALVASALAQAADVQVAVAANFTAPMQKIAAAFEQDTGHHAVLSFGSTGKFYAQIKNGAPYEILLAADAETPLRLEQESLGLPGTRFNYATGRLVLWSPLPGVVDAQGQVLRTGNFAHLAIADPKLAPYGAAAVEALTRLGLWQDLQPRLVQGESIGQAFQFVQSGNASLGLVALSQVMQDGQITAGSSWLVPQSLYGALRQDAITLRPGQDKPAAQALVRYLQGDKARAIIRAFGYSF